MRTLYTINCYDYVATLYASPEDILEVSWVVDKGTWSESSGSTTIAAQHAQAFVHKLEASGTYTVESIKKA